MSIRVAVVGAAGRMGRTVCEAVGAAEDMELVAELDAGDAITRESLGGAEVAVEFSVPGAAEANALAILDSGADAVVGTTGWTDEALERVRARAEKTGRSAVIAPNYALSAVLAMSFAERAAPFFESVEVIEMHHPDKADAPSGTAISTASRIARARAAAGVSPGPDATETDPFGARRAPARAQRARADPPGQPRRAAGRPARLLRPRELHARRPVGRAVRARTRRPHLGARGPHGTVSDAARPRRRPSRPRPGRAAVLPAALRSPCASSAR